MKLIILIKLFNSEYLLADVLIYVITKQDLKYCFNVSSTKATYLTLLVDQVQGMVINEIIFITITENIGYFVLGLNEHHKN